jgi:hypothetical protein
MWLFTPAAIFAGALALFAVAYYGLELTRTTNRARTQSRLVTSAGLVFLNASELMLHRARPFDMIALAVAVVFIIAGFVLRHRSMAAS